MILVTDDASPTSAEQGEQRQVTIDEFTIQPTSRCEAYANSTGERCQREPMGPLPYCSDHIHLLNEVDLDEGR